MPYSERIAYLNLAANSERTLRLETIATLSDNVHSGKIAALGLIADLDTNLPLGSIVILLIIALSEQTANSGGCEDISTCLSSLWHVH